MRNKIFLALSIVFLLMPFCANATRVKLTDIRVMNLSSVSQIKFQLSTFTEPNIFLLTHPNRLVIDFKNTQLAINLKNFHFSNINISRIRQGRPHNNVLRLVFETRRPMHFKKIFDKQKKYIIVELFSSYSKINSTKKIPIFSLLHRTLIPKRTMTVVIDPGHGGSDPGAVGRLGIKEKEVVLAMAKQLAELINQQPNMRAVLTRKRDYYVSLHNRLVLARKGKADLFVAIHADSYFNNNATGASVYALSTYGATSIAARWLAKRENYSELNRIDLSGLNDQSYILRSVLIDLAQTATIRDSLHLGNSLLHSLHSITTLHYSRVEQAPFMVLKSPDIPSILVETGFISNPHEELRLRDKKYQHKIALALFNGILFYRDRYVPSA